MATTSTRVEKEAEAVGKKIDKNDKKMTMPARSADRILWVDYVICTNW